LVSADIEIVHQHAGLIEPHGGVPDSRGRAQEDGVDDSPDAAGELPYRDEGNDGDGADDFLFVPEIEAYQPVLRALAIDGQFDRILSHMRSPCAGATPPAAPPLRTPARRLCPACLARCATGDRRTPLPWATCSATGSRRSVEAIRAPTIAHRAATRSLP